jgi:hypothetical protein
LTHFSSLTNIGIGPILSIFLLGLALIPSIIQTELPLLDFIMGSRISYSFLLSWIVSYWCQAIM